MRKNGDDVNWLSTLKKQFESCEIWKFLKLKIYWTQIFKFQESFTTCKWGVMYMTSKANF